MHVIGVGVDAMGRETDGRAERLNVDRHLSVDGAGWLGVCDRVLYITEDHGVG